MNIKKTVFKIMLLIGIIGSCLYELKYILEWYAESNESGLNTARQCIFKDKKKITKTIMSFNNNFQVTYVKNATRYCMHPYFPAINISTNAAHNKWVYFSRATNNIKTDAPKIYIHPNHKMHDLMGAIFIAEDLNDTDLKQKLFDIIKQQGYQSFYSSEQEFFAHSATISYNIMNKNSSTSSYRAYALQVDLDKKTIHCIGGISWGWYVPWWSIRPAMIKPTGLTEQDWQNDWSDLVLNIFKDYTKIDA